MTRKSGKQLALVVMLLTGPMFWLYRCDPAVEPREWRGDPVSTSSWVHDPLRTFGRARPLVHPGDPPATLGELRERVARVLGEYGVPGVGIALVDRQGVSSTMGVGVADRAGARAVDEDTVFRVGSISKSVVALCVLALVDEQRLSLLQPVKDLAPEVAMDNRWADTDPVRVAHVLEHTAGFDDIRFNELFMRADEPDPPLADVLARNPRSRESRWRPGSRFSYSNPGYTVAAYLVEKLSGMGFEDFARARVLAPMGMLDARFSLTPDLEARLARGYTGVTHGRVMPYRRLWHRPAGELLATPRDMAALLQMFLRRGQAPAPGGRIISERALARMERGETRDFPGFATGYGLGNYGDTSLAALTRGHDGAVPGFYSEYRYTTELGVGFALLFNSTGDGIGAAAAEIRALVFAYLTRGMKLPEPPSIELPVEELERYIGQYELASPRFALLAFVDRVLLDVRVSLVDGALELQLGNIARTRLIATAPGQFRLPGHSGPMVAFATDERGRRVLALADLSFHEVDSWWTSHRRSVLTTSIWLMDIGFFWNIVWLPGWFILVVRARRSFPLPKDALPALACACFLVMQKSFVAGWASGALGEVSALSLIFLFATVLFPLLSVLALVSAIRGLRRNHEQDALLDALVEEAGYITQIYSDGWQRQLYHVGTALACVSMSLYLGYHGIIGLCTWTW